MFRNWFRKAVRALRQTTCKGARPQSPRRLGFPVGLERLEDRVTPAYNVSLDAVGLLTISQATAGDTSHLSVSLAAGTYTFADMTLTFNAATGVNAAQVMNNNNGTNITVANGDVSAIQIQTDDGADVITLSAFDAAIDPLD
ncbi:MAG: hypothetical protein IT429_23530, partial [Gemmataceae bacterium]|nr:hypothetical protein [Gemmataceae bacterium]